MSAGGQQGGGRGRSAIALTDDQKSRLADALGRATGKQVEVKVIVDPSIKGGVVAQVGDTVIDGSIRRRLDQLQTPSSPTLPGPRRSDDNPLHGTRRNGTWPSSPSTPTTSPRRSQEPRGLQARPGRRAGRPRARGRRRHRHRGGLPDCAVNEMLEFEDGTIGLALNLDEDSIGAVVLGEVGDIEEGQVVKATGEILSVPCGDGLLGRVVNTLGEPIDGKGPLSNVGPAAWRSRRPASWAASPCTSRCRPASRPSTP
jgi:hypothetical protein